MKSWQIIIRDHIVMQSEMEQSEAYFTDTVFFFIYRQWSALWTWSVSVMVSVAHAMYEPAG